MKNIKFNVNKAFDLQYRIEADCICFINNDEVFHIYNPMYKHYDKDKQISEFADRLWQQLNDYEDRQNLYTDKDIDEAVGLYEEFLYELNDIWHQVHAKMYTIIDKELENIDTDCIKDCKIEYLGNGECQLSAESMQKLLKGFSQVRITISDMIIKSIHDFANAELNGELLSVEMRLGEIGNFKIIAYGNNEIELEPTTYWDKMSNCLINEKDLKANTDGDYGKVKKAYFHVPKLYSTYNNGMHSVGVGGDTYIFAGINKYATNNLMQDKSYAEQITKLKETIVNTLENANLKDVRGWSRVISRAKDLTDEQITDSLENHIDKIGKDFAKEYDALNEDAFNRIRELMDKCEAVPAEVFGNDFIEQDDSYRPEIHFTAVGWTQERIDEINSSLSRLYNEAVSIHENIINDIKPKTIEIKLGDYFAYHITFYALTNRTKGKQYEAVYEVLSKALNGYTLTIEDSLVAKASRFKTIYEEFGKLRHIKDTSLF